MKFLKPSLSIISIIMFSTTMIIGASAVNSHGKNTDNNSGELIDPNSISSSYLSSFGKIIPKGTVNTNSSSENIYMDMMGKIESKNQIPIVVKKTRSKLKPGDIVQIKDKNTPFLLYLGKDADGQVHLENSYKEMVYTPSSFNNIFTGKILAIVENNPNTPSVEAKTIQTSSYADIQSNGQQNQYNWDNAYEDPRIIEIAESLTEDKDTSFDKCNAIFKYVQENYSWHDHDNTECSLDEVLNNKTGNCCELSRLLVSLVKASDIPVETRYKHSNVYYYCSHVVHGHIDVQFNLDGNWVDADPSSDYTAFGQTSYLYREDSVVAYYDELPF